MNTTPILKIGNPLLQQVATAVTEDEINSPQLQEWLRSMKDTMIAENGAGLAAPQIGLSKRILMFGISTNPRYPNIEEVPFTVLINPVLQLVNDEQELGWEGCLSIPGYRGMVPRYKELVYSGQDENGHHLERHVDGFHARVFQHEFDHLEGVLYLQRIVDLRQFGLESELFPQSYAFTEPSPMENK